MDPMAELVASTSKDLGGLDPSIGAMKSRADSYGISSRFPLAVVLERSRIGYSAQAAECPYSLSLFLAWLGVVSSVFSSAMCFPFHPPSPSGSQC